MGKRVETQKPTHFIAAVFVLAGIVVFSALYFGNRSSQLSWFGFAQKEKKEKKPVDFSLWKLPSLAPGEVILGRRELRMPEKQRREVQHWDFKDEDGRISQRRINQLYEYIETHRAADFATIVNPFLVCRLGGKVMISKESFLTAAKGRFPFWRKKFYEDEENRGRWLRENELTEKILMDGSVAYERNGDSIYFKNVELHCYFQRRPNERHKKNRAPWGSKDFNSKYNRVTSKLGQASLSSSYKTKKVSVPGDVAFDPGVNEDMPSRPIDQARGVAFDSSMELFFELRGTFVFNGKEYEFGKDTPPIVARDYLFVKDYVPPLPEEPSGPTSERLTKRLENNDSDHAFVIPMARPHIFDNTSINLKDSLNPDERPIALNYWPNDDDVDRDGDGIKDYKWDSIALRQKGHSDGAVYQTLFYEIGLSLANRIKYKTEPSHPWRYMYYVPYRPVDGRLVGPYTGRVRTSPANMDGFDKYDIDHAEGNLFFEHYQPIRFPEKIKYAGRTYRPELLMEKIFQMADPGIEVAQKLQELASTTGFRHIGGISVIWGRENVNFLRVGSLHDPECRIPKGTLLIAPGFSACANANRGRRPSFEAHTESVKGKDSPMSLFGGVRDGSMARDCFFRMNSRDSANNQTSLFSGTYAAEDNLRPIPKLTLMMGKRVIGCATVPNDLTGAGLALGHYDPKEPNTRIHSEDIPVLIPSSKNSGVQGLDFRGYGNYSNNAALWSACSPKKTMRNPVDSMSESFLSLNSEEKLLGKTVDIVVEAKDNVGPSIDSEGKTNWPISKLQFAAYHLPIKKNKLEFASLDYRSLALSLNTRLNNLGIRAIKEATIVHDDQFDKRPEGTICLKLNKAGLWLFRVDVVDMSDNGRTMLALCEVSP